MTRYKAGTADFERRVKFEPGYNYLHEIGPSRRGQHGMGIRFLLIGPEGAAQFLMSTDWTPLGRVDEPRRTADGRWPLGLVAHISPTTHSYFPSAWDLGYHWSTPLYDGQGSFDCDVLAGGECYYDGSGLAAEDVLRDFITEGEPAVWRWLEKRYQWCVDAAVGATAETQR